MLTTVEINNDQFNPPVDYAYEAVKLGQEGQRRSLSHLDTVAQIGRMTVRNNERPLSFPTKAEAIKEWYQGLDPFNHLHEGQGDLLRAAGLVLHENMKPGEDFVVRLGESEDTLSAFEELFGLNDLEKQKSSENLLLMGMLILDAGWAERQPARQGRLFDMAEKVFERLYRDEQLPWQERHKRDAALYWHDLRFDRLHKTARQANDNQDNTRLGKTRELYRQQILLFANDFGRFSPLQAKTSGTAREKLSGEMLEWFALASMRQLALTLKGGLGFLEFRRSTLREDRPHIGYPETARSFDIVAQLYDKGNLKLSLPFQLKGEVLPNSQAKHGKAKAEYDPAVKPLRFTGLSMNRMLDEVRHMRQSLGNQNASIDEGVRVVQEKIRQRFAEVSG